MHSTMLHCLSKTLTLLPKFQMFGILSKFMVIEPWSGMDPSQPPQEPLLPLSEAGVESNTFSSSPLPELEELQYRNGWVAGIGRWNSNSSAVTRTGVVDLMLAPSDSLCPHLLFRCIPLYSRTKNSPKGWKIAFLPYLRRALTLQRPYRIS
jgi:hypothetical protein